MVTDGGTMGQIERFKRLFRGRSDVWGHNEGRCVKERLTDEHWREHLAGHTPIGVYPAAPTASGSTICVWGCTDIDIDDYGRAVLLQQTLAQVDVHCFIERSRSKGYHVWVFSDEPVDAKDMRNMQLVAHQVADIPPIEVNPKQTEVSPTQYGNYVRLPYPSGMVGTLERQVMLDVNGDPIQFNEFLDIAEQRITSAATIVHVASMYQPPKQQHVVLDLSDPSSDLAEGLRGISPLGYVIWRDGPLEGRDRSRTLMRLAHLCRESGMSPTATHMVVVDADKRWGKFHERGDEQQLQILVQRAFQ